MSDIGSLQIKIREQSEQITQLQNDVHQLKSQSSSLVTQTMAEFFVKQSQELRKVFQESASEWIEAEFKNYFHEQHKSLHAKIIQEMKHSASSTNVYVDRLINELALTRKDFSFVMSVMYSRKMITPEQAAHFEKEWKKNNYREQLISQFKDQFQLLVKKEKEGMQ